MNFNNGNFELLYKTQTKGCACFDGSNRKGHFSLCFLSFKQIPLHCIKGNWSSNEQTSVCHSIDGIMDQLSLVNHTQGNCAWCLPSKTQGTNMFSSWLAHRIFPVTASILLWVVWKEGVTFIFTKHYELIPICTVNISSKICILWYTIYVIYQLLHISTPMCHPQWVIITKVYNLMFIGPCIIVIVEE